MSSVMTSGHAAPARTHRPSPPDWRDVWIYALLIDRFNSTQHPPRAAGWADETRGFQGGTFDGIRARLDYLASIGAGAILLSPVLKNCQHDAAAYHGYGPQDLSTLEPRFSSDPARARQDPAFVEAEFEALVAAAHARGLSVLVDVVLHHAGDLFAYDGIGGIAPLSADPQAIHWRDEQGRPRPDWREPPADAPREAAIWPPAARRNEFFGRRGNLFSVPETDVRPVGDFYEQKEWATDYQERGRFPVRELLIAAYIDLLVRYDLDGFRVDTFKYLEPDFAAAFTRAVRERAAEIGKTDFLLVGEIWDTEPVIARFYRPPDTNDPETGPSTATAVSGRPGAVFDYPLFYALPDVVRGLRPPRDLAALYETRDALYGEPGDSSRDARDFFVSFLDNHDQHRRIGDPPAAGDPAADAAATDRATLALACLFCLRGIPCLYYGTEQGLHGTGGRVEAVREALWGKPDAFDPEHPLARVCRRLTALRREQPALRRGQLRFRRAAAPDSSWSFGDRPGGLLAFSRLLDGCELLVIANCDASQAFAGHVEIDAVDRRDEVRFEPVFSNTARGMLVPRAVVAHDGAAGALPIVLAPLEIQILIRGEVRRG